MPKTIPSPQVALALARFVQKVDVLAKQHSISIRLCEEAIQELLYYLYVASGPWQAADENKKLHTVRASTNWLLAQLKSPHYDATITTYIEWLRALASASERSSVHLPTKLYITEPRCLKNLLHFASKTTEPLYDKKVLGADLPQQEALEELFGTTANHEHYYALSAYQQANEHHAPKQLGWKALSARFAALSFEQREVYLALLPTATVSPTTLIDTIASLL